MLAQIHGMTLTRHANSLVSRPCDACCLVIRFRSSQAIAARSDTNFGIKGPLGRVFINSSCPLRPESDRNTALPQNDAMCQTLHFAPQEKRQPVSASDHHEVGHRPVSQAVISFFALRSARSDWGWLNGNRH